MQTVKKSKKQPTGGADRSDNFRPGFQAPNFEPGNLANTFQDASGASSNPLNPDMPLPELLSYNIGDAPSGRHWDGKKWIIPMYEHPHQSVDPQPPQQQNWGNPEPDRRNDEPDVSSFVVLPTWGAPDPAPTSTPPPAWRTTDPDPSLPQQTTWGTPDPVPSFTPTPTWDPDPSPPPQSTWSASPDPSPSPAPSPAWKNSEPN